ncbi:MAG: hypothetical protein RL662_528 [Bacteroidota bacterium]|jgi:hypothetical protein
MKKYLTFTSIVLLILTSSLFLSSCTEEKIISPSGDFAIVYNKYATIEANQWRWSELNGRYEASVSYPELQKDEYDDGITVGNIFTINNNNVEKLHPLPYIKTWVDGNSGLLYTETISCALSFDRKAVEFYIETSDKARDDSTLDEYEFKVAIIVNLRY